MPRLRVFVSLVLVVAVAGCEQAKDSPAGAPAARSEPSNSAAPASKSEETPQADPASVDLKPVTPEELQKLVAANKGKAVLVDFWASWCVPCRKGYPHTVELADKHPDDLVVYSVSMDSADDPDALNEAKTFLAEHPGDIRTLISAQGSDGAYTGFDITGGALPHYKVYDRDGQVVATFGGDVDVPIKPEEIDAAVETAIGK